MARSRATLHTSVWNPDSEFRRLTTAAQRLYFLLLSQGDLSLCGVAALTPSRWASMSSDCTPEDIIKALTELACGRYVVVDESTQEIWIRTFTTHDGVLRQPNVVVSMSRDFDAIQSNEIRQGFVEGLDEGLVDGLPAGYRERLSPTFLAWVLRVRTRAPSPTPSPSPTPPEAPTHPPKASQPYEAEFDEVWGNYPRKVERQRAYKAYVARRRTGVPHSDLLAATRHYAKYVAGKDPTYIKHGSTFFGPDEPFRDYVALPEGLKAPPVAKGAGDLFDNEADRQAFYDQYSLGKVELDEATA